MFLVVYSKLQLTPQPLFTDIDECVEGTYKCTQNCHNSTCGCNIGYRLNQNGFACDDIDECAEMIDHCNQNCQNSIGSYTCSCNTGFKLNSDGFRCDGE